MDDAGVIVAIVGVGVTLLGVLGTLLLSIRSDVKALHVEIAALRAEVTGIDKRLVAVETQLQERTIWSGTMSTGAISEEDVLRAAAMAEKVRMWRSLPDYPGGDPGGPLFGEEGVSPARPEKTD